MPNVPIIGTMPQRILRRTFSRFTWLKNRHWVPAKFPEMDRDWDFVHIPHLYRLHRAWDPFLFDWPSRAALATSDAQRALFYTTRQEVASDILPGGHGCLIKSRSNFRR